MSTTLSDVLRALRARLESTYLPPERKVTEHDTYSVVPSLEALQGNERDRVLYMILLSGPAPKTGVRCQDTARLAIGGRWFNEFESVYRMADDVPDLRERIRTATEIDGVKKCTPTGPLYDYQTLEKATLVVFDVTIEYEVGV